MFINADMTFVLLTVSNIFRVKRNELRNFKI